MIHDKLYIYIYTFLYTSHLKFRIVVVYGCLGDRWIIDLIIIYGKLDENTKRGGELTCIGNRT